MPKALNHLESESLPKDSAFDVISFGEVLWDIFPNRVRLGGAALNFAWHVADMGLDSLLVSGIGNDPAGIDIKDKLDSLKLPYSLSLSHRPSGSVNVSLNAKGQPSFDIVQDSAWDEIVISDHVIQAVSKAQAIYFGSLSQRSPQSADSLRTLVNAFEASSGKYRFFDVNLRPPHSSPEALRWGLSHCDVLKFSDEEMCSFARAVLGLRTESAEIVANLCFDRWPISTIVQTRGAAGAKAWTRDGQHATCEAAKCKVVDTVGAGDAFSAAFLVSLFHDIPLTGALEFGNRRATSVCEQDGALLV